uniref:Uncharacterized protein n=1 Tax=Esox lucius TaxID=8010 RepID=A0AAY5JX18_ESOLU
MAARMDKKELMVKLKKLMLKQFQQLQRRLGRKTNDNSVKNMGVKDTVRFLMKNYGEKASDVLSQTLNHSKHKRKQSQICQGNDNENQTSTASAVENNDKQVMGVSCPSTVTHVGGALAENRVANGNSITAVNGSIVFNPTITGCSINGNVIINESKTISDQNKEDSHIVVDPGSNLKAFSDHRKRTENILRIKDKIKVQQKKSAPSWHISSLYQRSQKSLTSGMKKTSDEGFYRLAPALLSCTTALLNFCHITPLQCATVVSVLRSEFSRLTVLDLGHNNLGDAGVKHLCDCLGHPNCKVKSLNLSHNNVGNQGVEELCRVLTRPKLKLLILDLSCNDFGDSGLELLAYALHEGFSLQVLRLSGCSITLHG